MTIQPVDSPTILSNRFVLANELREGGMGSIQKAYDVLSQEHVAIKRMLLQGDPERQKTSVGFHAELSRLVA